MNIQVFTKIFVPSILTALVMSVIAGLYSQESLGQTSQEQIPASAA